ncbi:[FeFe] hydrogenase H-cluster maturation GTPase HydF [Alistipes sp. ZOR0009]|uniref:[FeFe] hydrogenase H-cluster maturation GTPase HydF n=1 Tax=Alistipes sp. ZOR0009 TaxID=1339253 RepID=UPI0006455C9D|nr:[FeFe] hydrogenase H-cluster maturation GTPase HydF [Alistipes sp. ZOR0009]
MSVTRDNKPHIGIYGRRNSGKSTLINLLAGQEVAIVSNHAGTTTDPVKKSVEILNLGPVILVDTAGVDDEGELGLKRVSKTRESIKMVDLALLVIAHNQFGEHEEVLINEFNRNDIPFIIVFNMVDATPPSSELISSFKYKNLAFTEISAINGNGFDELVKTITSHMPESAYTTPSMFKGIVKKNDIVLLITPIDTEAPAGRMILPQVQAIRDVLDNDAIAITLKENAVEHFLASHKIKPALAVTDSQIFDKADRMIPLDIPLTSFSITLSRLKGPFDEYLKGTPKIGTIKEGDRILILESCTHHTSCDDIGRYKIPRWLKEFSGKNPDFDIVAGLSAISRPITDYSLIIQCGGCMITRKQVFNRLRPAIEAGIPITNYGMAIAYMKGIFNRAVAPFKPL